MGHRRTGLHQRRVRFGWRVAGEHAHDAIVFLLLGKLAQRAQLRHLRIDVSEQPRSGAVSCRPFICVVRRQNADRDAVLQREREKMHALRIGEAFECLARPRSGIVRRSSAIEYAARLLRTPAKKYVFPILRSIAKHCVPSWTARSASPSRNSASASRPVRLATWRSAPIESNVVIASARRSSPRSPPDAPRAQYARRFASRGPC
jgi:hypothetical protein